MGRALELAKPRIGLWDRYGGSMPSGWVRFILDEFGMDFELVFPQELDAGDLADEFDVLIFPDGAIPSPRPAAEAGGMAEGWGPGSWRRSRRVPGPVGSVTAETTVPQLRAVPGGWGNHHHPGGIHEPWATTWACRSGTSSPMPTGYRFATEEFFVPGSLLEVKLQGNEPRHPRA